MVHNFSKNQEYRISLDEINARFEKKKESIARKRERLSDNLFPFTLNSKKIFNSYGEQLVRVDGDIPVNLEVQNEDRFLFISYDQSFLSHGIHKYPAKFFPELPRWLIQRYSAEKSNILDPFSGSGTTSIEANLLRRNSVGIDIDPFAKFLSRVIFGYYYTTFKMRVYFELLLTSNEVFFRGIFPIIQKIIKNKRDK
jgi:DNA modification methylase